MENFIIKNLTNNNRGATLSGIRKQVDIPENDTVLYSSSILVGSDLIADMDNICFELPANWDINQPYVNGWLTEIVFNFYKNQNKNTVGNVTYNYIGGVKSNFEGQIDYINPYMPHEHIDNILKDLNKDAAIIAKNKQKEKEKEIAEREALDKIEMERKISDAIKQGQQYEINKCEKTVTRNKEKWNNPIWVKSQNYYGQSEYSFYQQSSEQEFTTLKDVQYIAGLKHRDGSIGFAYTARANNVEDTNYVQLLAKVDPIVCFEIPCPIESLDQNQHADIIRNLGLILNNEHLNQIGAKNDGTITYAGRVRDNGFGQMISDCTSSTKIIQDYINNYNNVLMRNNISLYSNNPNNIQDYDKDYR